jgi:hypothetical protein
LLPGVHIREEYARVRDEYFGKLDFVITEGGKRPPGWERGKPGRLTPEVETILKSRAREIVKERERTREAILRSAEGLKVLYSMLDSDIDAIKGIIENPNPPADWQKQLFEFMQRLNDRWPTERQLMDERIDGITRPLGCPMLFATNP